MTELIIIAIFASALVASVITGVSVLVPLVFGFFLFFGYGLRQGRSWREMAGLAWSGVSQAKVVILVFAMVGMITGSWRASGTIAYIVYYASKIAVPEIMVLLAFVFCCVMSFIIGTSFGAVATMGVICMTMARGMGIPAWLAGGAILAGCAFGDRCSPVSSSALLVAEVTGTNIYENVKKMLRSALVPSIACCVIYLILGWVFLPENAAVGAGPSSAAQLTRVFLRNFQMTPWLLVPAVIILGCAVLKVNILISIALSVAGASILGVLVQGMTVLDMLKILIFGFKPEDPALAKLLGGGGVSSMVLVLAITIVSMSYSDILEKTGFLNGIRGALMKMSKRMSKYTAILIQAVVTVFVSCNQTLAIVLTNQLCRDFMPDREDRMLAIEDLVILPASLVPWSVGVIVPVEATGAPMISVLFAFYLFLVPIWSTIVESAKERKAVFGSASQRMPGSHQE